MAAKKATEKKLSRDDVVKQAVAALQGVKSIGGAKVVKSKVEEGSKIFFQLDNGFTARARVKAGKTK